MKVKKLITVVAAFAAAISLQAQTATYNDTVRTKTWSVYVQGGVGGYHGMRGVQYDGKSYVAPQTSLGVNYTIKPWWRVGMNLNYIYLKSADKGAVTETSSKNYTVEGQAGILNTTSVRLQNRNMNHILGADLNVDFNIMDIWHNRNLQKFNLWAGTGIGYIHGWNRNSNTWAVNEECVAQGDTYFNIYNHSYLSSKQLNGSSNALYIPITVSAEYDVHPKLTIGVQGQYKCMPQDKIGTPKGIWSAGVVIRYNFIGKSKGMKSYKQRYHETLAQLYASQSSLEQCNTESAKQKETISNLEDEISKKVCPPVIEVKKPEIQGTTIYFDNNSVALDLQSKQAIKEMAERLKASGETMVIMTGSANTIGAASYNMRLSEGRIKTVRKALLKAGVQTNQISEEHAIGEKGMTADKACRRVIIAIK